MKVTIIGAGNVGKALATSMIRAGHEVTITAKNPGHAKQAADEVGAGTAASNAAAAATAEVVVLAVPFVGAGEDVADDIRTNVAGKTVIDATNPIRLDYSGLATSGSSGAEHFQELLPDARVVKAFNTIFASNQANPTTQIDAFVAADDDDAKRRALELVESMGFRPLDVGPLSAARHLEGMAFMNIGLNAQHGWSWTSSWKLER